MSITLTLEQEKLVRALLSTGRFRNADEVIPIALHLLEKENRADRVWLNETRAKIDEGIESLERGEGIDGEKYIHQLLGQLQQVKEIHY